MHFLLEFCMTKYWPDVPTVKYSPGLHGFSPCITTQTPQVGDLVIVTSTRSWSKWNIGWLHEIINSATESYCVRSLEDGSLCNWTNVGIEFMERKVVEEHKSWRWSDKQFAFNDRWLKVCYKECGAFMLVPLYADFNKDGSVTLRTRTRYGMDDALPERHFDDWRKVTKAMMKEAYEAMVAERKQGS